VGAAMFPCQHTSEILCKAQIECPIEGDADFFLYSRKFAQIDCSPQPPGEEARKIHPENVSHASVTTDRCKLPDGSVSTPERKYISTPA
jgi:hypothetical protein